VPATLIAAALADLRAADVTAETVPLIQPWRSVTLY